MSRCATYCAVFADLVVVVLDCLFELGLHTVHGLCVGSLHLLALSCGDGLVQELFEARETSVEGYWHDFVHVLLPVKETEEVVVLFADGYPIIDSLCIVNGLDDGIDFVCPLVLCTSDDFLDFVVITVRVRVVRSGTSHETRDFWCLTGSASSSSLLWLVAVIGVLITVVVIIVVVVFRLAGTVI